MRLSCCKTAAEYCLRSAERPAVQNAVTGFLLSDCTKGVFFFLCEVALKLYHFVCKKSTKASDFAENISEMQKTKENSDFLSECVRNVH